MMKKKLKSQTGESIGETLVSLLIAALALVMLAGAVSASSGVIMKGRNKLNAYYTANYVRWAKKFAALIDFGSKELVQLVQTSSRASKSLQNES